ncbi:hypothetical protein HAP48_0011450 [Bradyrhizobium septentrionale]|uniref:Uncharacterized protein n=1 Tax=Bradyrhizobium septentrionale TaxID=1404411 RepID=A0A973W833_9BRAD|nr:hypothetical protein [Bradyrhizobium septentrionale]UGY17987.1 hypothetical protein HAP48_0011450 [Bradyrhizobium septentrionale]
MANEKSLIFANKPELTEQEKLFEDTHKRAMELVRRTEQMMLSVVKTQVIVEGFMIELLEAYGKDPSHFFYTGKKIEELRDRIDPPEVGRPIWELLSLCSHVRNELVHSLQVDKIKEKSQKVREAYLAMTPEGARKEGIKGMNDTELVTDAIRHCGSYIVIATYAKGAADKKAKTTPG